MPVNEYFQLITRRNSQNINSGIVRNSTETLIHISPLCSFYFNFFYFFSLILFHFYSIYFILLNFSLFQFTLFSHSILKEFQYRLWKIIPDNFTFILQWSRQNLSWEFDLFFNLSSRISKCIKTRKTGPILNHNVVFLQPIFA